MKNDSNDNNSKKFWQIGITFGLTIGASIYLVGILFGDYLDEKFDAYPIYTLVGTLLAVFASFYRLVHDFALLDKSKKKDKEN